MNKETRFVDMVVAFVVLGIALVTFLVLFIEYEVARPNLPTPTPVPTDVAQVTATPLPTNRPKSTPSPSPSPSYSEKEWKEAFTIPYASYEVTESTTNADGLTLVTSFKVADGSAYFFNQTSEKAAREGWNLILGNDKYLFVADNMTLNKDGQFVVNKSGYKTADTTQKTLAAKNDKFVDDAKTKIKKYYNAIPYSDYECIEPLLKYRTGIDNKYQASLSFEDGKLKTMYVEYVDDTDPENIKTISVSIEINGITGEDIVNTNPVK